MGQIIVEVFGFPLIVCLFVFVIGGVASDLSKYSIGQSG